MLALFPKIDGYGALLGEVQHRLDHNWAGFETMTAFGHLAAVDHVSPLAEDDAGKIAPLDWPAILTHNQNAKMNAPLAVEDSCER